MITVNNKFVVLFILSLSIAPAIFLGEGNRNLLLIGVMFITPIILIKFFKIEKIDLLLIVLFLFMLINPYFIDVESYRLSTVLYSILFGLFFITYKQLLIHASFDINSYIKLIKFIIYSYFIVLVIQQICVLIGLPIFNISNYEPNNPWKLNSLSAEPSHTARIVPLLMFSYIIIKEVIEERKYNFSLDFTSDRYLWIGFIWIIFTSGSSTAYLFFLLVLVYFLSFKNSVVLILLSLTSFALISFFEISSFQRSIDFFMAVLTFDVYTMMSVDHSASMRVAPLFVVFDNLNLSTITGLFGNGIDSTSNIISKIVYGIGENATGGGTFQLWYEYGFFVFILFVSYSFITVYDKNSKTNILFWFLLVFIVGINNQMVWLCLVLLYTNKYFRSIKVNQ